LIGHNYSFRTYVQQGLRREAYMSGVYYPVSTTSPRAAVSITRPIRQGSAVVGVAVVGTYSLAESRALDLKAGLTALVLENDGVIASSNDPNLAMGIAGPDDAQGAARRRQISQNASIDNGKRFRRLLDYHPVSTSLLQLLTSRQAGVGAGSLDGEPMVMAWEPMEAYGAKAVVMESQQEQRQAIEAVHRQVMLLTSIRRQRWWPAGGCLAPCAASPWPPPSSNPINRWKSSSSAP
jgi:C4-dicarboxylate-specific signal transduction histidine kinase